MSSGIFVEESIGAHNPEMADRHQTPAYPLRLPDELKAQVVEAAGAAGRSLNAEIVHRLAQSFEARGVLPSDVRLLLDNAELQAAEAELDKHLLRTKVAEHAASVRLLGEQLERAGVQVDRDEFVDQMARARQDFREAVEEMAGIDQAADRLKEAYERLSAHTARLRLVSGSTG
jgi:cell fate regulator YaaT (PSP1 superfamily)